MTSHRPRESAAAEPVDNPPVASVVVMDGQKRCRGCQQDLPLDAFARSSRDGRQSSCRDCKRAYNEINRESIRLREAEAYQRRKAAAGQTPSRRLPAKSYLERTYGITDDQFCRMVVDQRGLCAICHLEPSERGLVVDHDHDTGRVRGLLCDRCNRALGGFRDNPVLVERALDYLERGA